MTPKQAYAAVKRGAHWLDSVCPGWVSHVDLSHLDMANGFHCILGQTADCILGPATDGWQSGYWRVRKLKLGDVDWPSDHGFDAPPGATLGEARYGYSALAEAWDDEIRDRLQKAPR